MNLYSKHTNPETLYGYKDRIKIPLSRYNEYVSELLNWVQQDEFDGIIHLTDSYFAEHEWTEEVIWPEFANLLRSIVTDFEDHWNNGYYVVLIAERLMKQRNTNPAFDRFDLEELSALANKSNHDDPSSEDAWLGRKPSIIKWINGGFIK
jgi:hypothetical protein